MHITFDFYKKLGDFTLNVDGKFESGIVGVFGESGSGKTTFLHCLTGFLKPQCGKITVGDQILFSSEQSVNVPIEKRNIGMVFQEALLFPHLSVKENVLYGLPRKASSFSLDELIDILNLYKLIDRKPHNLSGGEKQRAALARTLIRRPSVILMDEPISSLDIKARHQVIAYLKKIHQRFKIPLVYVSHSISELLYLTQRVMVIENGQSVDYGEPFDTLLTKDVLHHTDAVDVENIYDLPVQQIKEKDHLAVLDFFGKSLSVVYHSGAIKPRMRIGIKAKDIIVAKSSIKGLSARNIVEATLDRIVKKEDEVVLYTLVNDHGCLVEITSSALNDLKLKEKQKIYLIIKARSITIFD